MDSCRESRVSVPPRLRLDGWGVWGEGILAFHHGSKEDTKVLTCSSQVWEGDKEQVIPKSGLARKGVTRTGLSCWGRCTICSLDSVTTVVPFSMVLLSAGYLRSTMVRKY